MKTVKEVSKLTGVSRRTLHYYDEIGLLRPTSVTEAGYRLYDDEALERLQQIMLYRELEFSLNDIKQILESSDYDRNRVLEQQIRMLTLKKEHIENLIDFARGIKMIGVRNMDFSAFDTKKLDEYARQAKAAWGQTDAYKEFEKKMECMSQEDNQVLAAEFMELFAEFGAMKQCAPEEPRVQSQVQKLQDYITQHFYTCTREILKGLGKMYAGGGSMTENIDKVGGDGTARFAAEAIEVYCSSEKNQ